MPYSLPPPPSSFTLQPAEFAGHAIALSSRTQKDETALSRWNPDTGATMHMTPHRHWFTSYSPHVVPVRLANNFIVWSAGLGSVEFQPKFGDKSGHHVVFHDVLHVPALGGNLLSLLHLSRAKGYHIVIEGAGIYFHYNNQLVFMASVTEQNVGFLNGHTVIPQSANSVSTCPLDLTLWHRRCSHLNFEDVKRMHNQNLVTGMKLQSQASPDPICEPCILGKQHRHNIPKTASRHTSLLGLVHTDLKGSLPVPSPDGYRY